MKKDRTTLYVIVAAIAAFGLFVLYEHTPMAVHLKVTNGLNSDGVIDELPGYAAGTASKGKYVLFVSENKVVDSDKIGGSGKWSVNVDSEGNARSGTLYVTNVHYDDLDKYSGQGALASKDIKFSTGAVADENTSESIAESDESDYSDDSTTESSSSTSSSPSTKQTNKQKKVALIAKANSDLKSSLAEDKKYAKENDKYAMSTYLISVKIDKNHHVKAQATTLANALTPEYKKKLAEYAQSLALASLMKLDAQTNDDLYAGMYTAVFHGEIVLARSTAFNAKKFKTY